MNSAPKPRPTIAAFNGRDDWTMKISLPARIGVHLRSTTRNNRKIRSGANF
jgi:hypothetical protein